MIHRSQIQNAILNNYSFNIGDYISKGIDIFKKNPGGYIGYTVLYFIISLIISFIPFLGFLIGIVINPSLTVGFAIAGHKQVSDNDLEFGNFFKGFDHIAQLIVANIIMSLIYLILALPLIIKLGFSFFTSMSSGDPGELLSNFELMQSFGVWFLIEFIIILYVAISMRWTFFLIVFHKYDAVEAIKTSWQLTNKKWFLHFLFLVVCGLLGLLGFIALFVGIIFAYPIIMLADYAGYADVSGLNNSEDVIDEIGIDADLV